MTTTAQKWIAELNTNILKMSTLVEESLRTTMAALVHKNGELAKRVAEQDLKIDALENRIRDDVVKTLALQQPVGGDLRFLISILHMINELERVGDSAVNVANRVRQIVEADEPESALLPELQEMGDLAERMLTQAINSFVKQDTGLARQVIGTDPQMDSLCAGVEDGMLTAIRAGTRMDGSRYHCTVIALNLERIGDQATNLAEEVVFLVEGQNIRHQQKEKLPSLQFAISPLIGLERHAEVANQCLGLARQGLERYLAGESQQVAEFALQVSQKEHEADAIKRNIRGHLPKGIIMPVDKFELFAFIKEQDKVADDAQTLMDWLSLMECRCADRAKTLLALFDKCSEAAQLLPRLVVEADNFFSNKSDRNRSRVKQVIYDIRQMEHEADALEMGLKHMIFKGTTDPILLHHQLTTIDIIGQIANHAENAADMMRAMVAK
ncbi:MAG: phosphate signaling complex protein PhoU [Desulfobacteraceae bacterium]|nr:phosphate signaling complex protein PhoU [Desulfobacteraceae bacterium]